MDVETLTDPAAFRNLQAEWLGLLAQMPFQSVFLTPQWQEIWWRHFAGKRRLCLLTVRSDDGVLRGLAPLMHDTAAEVANRLVFIGDLEVSDYCDILVDPAYLSDVGAALVPVLLDHTGDEGDLWLQNLPANSLTPGLLNPSLESHGLSVEIDPIETCPTLTLAADWETYLAQLRSKDRHELRRKLRRAAATAQIEYRTSHEGLRLDADLELFFSLHRMSQQPDKQTFMTESKAGFFRDLAHTLSAYGWFKLDLLYADGVAIAALCSLPYGQTCAAYNASYHPAYKDLSAGIVLFANCIQNAIDRQFTTFDFLRGNEPYKYRFGAGDTPLSQLYASTACSVPGLYS